MSYTPLLPLTPVISVALTDISIDCCARNNVVSSADIMRFLLLSRSIIVINPFHICKIFY